MELKNWIEAHKLTVNWLNGHLLEIEGFGSFLLIESKEIINDEGITELKVIDEDFTILLSPYENQMAAQVDNFLFQFGERYYYSPVISERVELHPFKYLGKATLEFDNEFTHLGVHGKYELMNGSRDYSDWCKKAKFLGMKSLAIVEKNTLAGTLPFQMSCDKNKIKSIIGETITIAKNTQGEGSIEGKVYVCNSRGWKNLLRINKAINVDNNKFIVEEDLFNYAEGLIFVFCTSVKLNNAIVKKYQNALFENLFYQFDTVEYLSDEKDREVLENLSIYLNQFSDTLEPVLINDSYYLDKDDFPIKKILNKVASGASHNQSDDQYFKDLDDSFLKIGDLFDPEKAFKNGLTFYEFFQLMIENANWIGENCNYKIELGKLHLPKFEVLGRDIPEGQREIFAELFEAEYGVSVDDNEGLFYSLIEHGFAKKVSGQVEDEDEYYERLETEIGVIKKGGFIDYFLILWDIKQWCVSQKILVGTGRGSAAGSLVAYLLDVVTIDPIKYNLLFERFLNESRISKGLPDIDTDFMGTRREEVKRYLRDKYGADYVTSIGTYTNLKLKGALTDLARERGHDYSKMKILTSTMNDLEDDKSYVDLFRLAQSTPLIKDFIKKNFDIISNIELCLNQPKSASVHAAGMIVVPKEYNGEPMTVYDWMPVKMMDGVLVSEWEGTYIEAAGFLKEDILGLKELDKFSVILESIEKNRGEKIEFASIPLDDEGVFEYFQKGLTEDVFQFGSPGLKGYCRDLKPESIDDLIAANALYRPGTMDTGAHNDYIKIKNGNKEPEFDYMLEEVTKDTYGIMIYQEQIMQAFQVLAGFSLVESDLIRKAMGKKDKDLMDKYKTQFIEGAGKNGCDEEGALKIWNKIETFSRYGFNRCISGGFRFYKVGYNNSNSMYRPTIEGMYKIKNDVNYAKSIKRMDLHKKYKNYGYGVGFSLNEKNKLVRNKIVDIRCEGKQHVYRMTLENGTYIDTTLNHSFPTNNGKKKLYEIDPDQDLIFINKGYKQEDWGFRYNTDNNNHPKKGQCGFQKKDTSSTQFEKLGTEMRQTIFHCELCSIDLNSSKIKKEVHHIDGDHGNNVRSNLMLLCPSCHKKEHYKMGRVKMGEKGLETELVKIVSIEYLKEELVYDVEMAAPYHTFLLDNGIVTCNSHAAAYSVMGYFSQWFKYNYPLEFWTASLQFAGDDEIQSRISELSKLDQQVKLAPPDVNYSGVQFISEPTKNLIYWSITKIKQIGEATVQSLISERELNGDFYSLEEFMERVDRSKVNKRVILHLILSGSFDDIEGVKTVQDRHSILMKFYKILGEQIPDEYNDPENIAKEHYWTLMQRELSGFGHLDFHKIICESSLKKFESKYIDGIDFFSESSINKETVIAGLVSKVIERNSRRGKFAQIDLSVNDEIMHITCWADVYEENKKELKKAEGKILIMTGKIVADSYKRVNVLHTSDKTKFEII